MRKSSFILVCILIISPVFISSLNAQFLWGDGVPVRTGPQLSWTGASGTNQSGETYIVWDDCRQGFRSIYAQKYSIEGHPLWIDGGINIGGAFIYSGLKPAIDLVENDGFVVAWGQLSDTTGVPIKAQRIDSQGNRVWDPEGVTVNCPLYMPIDIRALHDGANGAFVVWSLFDGWTELTDIYVQRIDSLGNVASGWPAGGVLVASQQQGETIEFITLDICTDGENGIIIAWNDQNGSFDIHAQRVNGAGELLWGPTGAPVCAYTGTQRNPHITPDQAGGAFFVWEDCRYSYYDPDIFIQRMDANGNPLWTLNGIQVNFTGVEQMNPEVVSDGLGGAIVAWQDGNYSTSYYIYSQRLNGSGTLLWNPSGVLIYGPTQYFYGFNLSSDNAGGAFIVWYYSYVYGQYVNANGQIVWQAGGIDIGQAGNSTMGPPFVSSLIDGGAIFVWNRWADEKEGIFVQKADALGHLLLPFPGEAVFNDIAGEGDYIALEFLPPDKTIAVYADTRTNSMSKMFFQIFDLQGNPQVEVNGLALSTRDYNQYDQKIAATSDGAAITVWEETENVDSHKIFAQKVDSSGNVLWAPNAVQMTNWVTQVHHIQFWPFVCSDNAGGAYTAFHSYDGLSAINSDIYIVLVDATGHLPWGSTAVGATYSNLPKQLFGIVADGEGGAILTWDCSDINYQQNNVYAARVLPAGIFAWNQAVCELPEYQGDPYIIPSRDGGAIIAWEDWRDDWYRAIYAQKIDNEGNFLWGANGVPIIDLEGGSVEHVMMVEDDEGFTYYIWEDGRGVGYRSFYCQRLNPNGHQMFPPEGICVCDETEYPDLMDLVADGEGGIIVVWDDDRDYNQEVYITHLDAQGRLYSTIWIEDGNPVGGGFGSRRHSAMTSDEQGGAIIGWTGTPPILPTPVCPMWDTNVYIQRMNENIASVNAHNPQALPTGFCLYQNYPNPFNSSTTVPFNLNQELPIKLVVYNQLGQEVQSLVTGQWSSGKYSIIWNAEGLGSGVYFISLESQQARQTRKMMILK